ncbi:hypothetical protein LEP1GSC068_0624 [Leptospira sp. Fiocruz LV3954]|nr:hypothetical protein LEP1GSC068_0624 [Leptospira sp. Fiocruz LV3954]
MWEFLHAGETLIFLHLTCVHFKFLPLRFYKKHLRFYFEHLKFFSRKELL